MAGSGDRPPSCSLRGVARCPPECLPGEPCRVVRILHRDGTSWWGVPLEVVGETLRFRRVLPSSGVFLVPLGDLDPAFVPESVEKAGRASRAD